MPVDVPEPEQLPAIDGGSESRRKPAGRAASSVDMRLLGLVAVVAAVLGGGVVVLVVQQFRSPPEPSIVVAPPPSEADKPTPESAPAPRGPSPEELAAQHKAAAARKEQEALNRARQQAFRDLKAKLEQARHLPLKADVNLEGKAEQTISLCDLGAVEVGLALPERLSFTGDPGRPAWKLEPAGEPTGPWSIRLADTASAQRLDLARVEVQREGERRLLALRLLEMPRDQDPVWVAGRQALTTAPLVLRLPGESLAAFETHVQPCMPKQFAPLRFEGLLTEKGSRWMPKGGKPGDVLQEYPLPETPWACRVELEGRGRDGITADVVARSPDPKAIAARSRLQPLEVTARWTWSGEPRQPFMETSLSLQNMVVAPGRSGGGACEVRVTDSKVLPPWDGWRRFAELRNSGNDQHLASAQLPDPLPAFFRHQLPGPAGVNGELEPVYTVAMLASYGEMAGQYGVKINPQRGLTEILSGGQAQAAPKPMGEWQQSIRDLLESSPTYQKWVNDKAPDPGPRPGAKDPGLATWQEARAKRATYAASGPDVAKRFWEELKADKSRHDTAVGELMLCCLLFEVEPVLTEKRLAQRLLEAVGDGTVELTGRVWVDVDASGTHKVLVAEFAAEPDSRRAEDGARKAAAADAISRPNEISAATSAMSPNPWTGP